MELSMHCVTVAEYQEFLYALEVKDRKMHVPDNWNVQFLTPNWPVRQVSALDAYAYCQCKGVRLPTEEEWIDGITDVCPSGLWEWTSTEKGGQQVLRGGSWLVGSRFARVSLRVRLGPDFRGYSLSFRVI